MADNKDLALHEAMVEGYLNRANEAMQSPAFKELTADEQQEYIDNIKYIIKDEQQKYNEKIQALTNTDAESAYAEPTTLQGKLNKFMEESDPASRGVVGGAVGFAAPVARGAVKLASMPYARTMQYYNALIGNDAEAKLYKQAEENLNRDFAENYAPRVFQDPSMYDSGTSKVAAYLGNAAEGVRELAAPLGVIGRYSGGSKMAKFGLEAAYFALEGANAHTDFIEEKTGKFKPFAGLGDSTVKAVALTAMLGILHNKGMSPDAIRATILDKARSNSLVESVWKYGKDVAADGLKSGLAFAGSDFLGQLADEAQVYSDDKGKYDFNEGIQRLKENSYKGFGQGLLFGVIGSLGKQGNVVKMVKEYGRENILNGHVRDVIFEEVDKTNNKLGKMFGKGNVNDQNREYASRKILEALDRAGTRLRKEKGVSKAELDSFENYYRDLSRILNGEMGGANTAEGARASQVNRLNEVIEDKSTPLSEKQEAAKQKQDVNTEYGVKLQQEYEANRNQNPLISQTVDERPAIYPEDVNTLMGGQDWTDGEAVYPNTPEMTNRLFRGKFISPESGETIYLSDETRESRAKEATSLVNALSRVSDKKQNELRIDVKKAVDKAKHDLKQQKSREHISRHKNEKEKKQELITKVASLIRDVKMISETKDAYNTVDDAEIVESIKDILSEYKESEVARTAEEIIARNPMVTKGATDTNKTDRALSSDLSSPSLRKETFSDNRIKSFKLSERGMDNRIKEGSFEKKPEFKPADEAVGMSDTGRTSAIRTAKTDRQPSMTMAERPRENMSFADRLRVDRLLSYDNGMAMPEKSTGRIKTDTRSKTKQEMVSRPFNWDKAEFGSEPEQKGASIPANIYLSEKDSTPMAGQSISKNLRLIKHAVENGLVSGEKDKRTMNLISALDAADKDETLFLYNSNGSGDVMISPSYEGKGRVKGQYHIVDFSRGKSELGLDLEDILKYMKDRLEDGRYEVRKPDGSPLPDITNGKSKSSSRGMNSGNKSLSTNVQKKEPAPISGIGRPKQNTSIDISKSRRPADMSARSPKSGTTADFADRLEADRLLSYGNRMTMPEGNAGRIKTELPSKPRTDRLLSYDNKMDMPSDVGDIKIDTRSKTKQEMVSRPFGWDKAEFGSEPENKQTAKTPAVKKTSASKVEAKDIPQGIKDALKSDKTVDSASKKALLKGLKGNNIKLVDESVTGNSDLDTFKAGDTYIGLKKNSKLASELKKNIGKQKDVFDSKNLSKSIEEIEIDPSKIGNAKYEDSIDSKISDAIEKRYPDLESIPDKPEGRFSLYTKKSKSGNTWIFIRGDKPVSEAHRDTTNAMDLEEAKIILRDLIAEKKLKDARETFEKQKQIAEEKAVEETKKSFGGFLDNKNPLQTNAIKKALAVKFTELDSRNPSKKLGTKPIKEWIDAWNDKGVLELVTGESKGKKYYGVRRAGEKPFFKISKTAYDYAEFKKNQGSPLLPDGTDSKSKFSKDLQNSEGFVPVKKAQMSVDEIKSQIAKDYPQLNGVDFTVVENGDMFPDAEGIAKENGVDSVSDLALNAVQVGNKVYINAERMDTPEKVAMTVYHEAIEHIGFEKFIGEKPLDDLRKAILEEAEDDKELKELKKRTLEEDSNTEKDSKLLADEMMGRIAGDIPKKGKGVWEKIKKAFDKVKSLFIRKLYKMGWLKNISAKEAVKWIAELIAKRGIKPDDRPDGTYDNIIKGVKKSGKSIENIKKTKVRKSSGSDLYLAGTRELIYNSDLQSSILSDSNDSGVRKTKKFGIVMNSGKYHAYVRNPDYTYDVFDGFDTPEEALNALEKEADYYGIDRSRISNGRVANIFGSNQSVGSKNNGSSTIRRRPINSGSLDSGHTGKREQKSDDRGDRRTQEGNPEGKKEEKRRFSSEGRIKKINLEAEHKKYVDSMKSPETYDQIRIQSAKGKFNLGKAARKNEYYRGIRQGFDDMKKQLKKAVQSGRKEAVTEFRQNIRQLNDYAQKFVKNKGDLARLERVISENASTPAGYAKAIRTMEELVDTRLRRDELSDFRSLMKEIRKRPLHSVIKEDIGDFLGEELTDEDIQGLMKGQGFHAAGLAKIRTTAENLRKVISKLSKNAELDEIDVPEFIKDFAKINDVDKFLLDSKGSELDSWIKETIQEQVPAAKVSPEQLAKVNSILHHFLTAQDAIEKSLSGYYMEEAQKTADKIASELPPSKATPEKDYEAGLIRRSLMPVGAYNSLDGENFTELMGETGKKVFHTDMVDGYEKMQHYQRQGYQVIDELREGYGDDWRRKLDKNIGTVRSTDGKRISITRGEAMALVATAMDTDTAKLIDGGRNQFVLGRKRNGSPIIFTMKQIQAVSDALDSRDLEAVRKITDMIATYKPLINATKEEISGFESISRDNYFPRFSTRTAKDTSVFNTMSAPFKGDATNAEWVGIAKHRENGGESFIIRDIFDVAEHYIDQASLYSGMAVPARAADRLLRNPKFAGSVSNSLGTDYLNILKHRISAYAGMAGKTNETTITNAIRKLVGRTAGSKLTPFSALKQLTTVHLASPIIKHRYLARGWKDINNPEVEKRMMDTDLGYLRYRDTALASLIDSGNKTFADARDFARSQINTNKYSPFKWFAELSTKFDKKALTVIFRGAELQAKAEGKGAERAEELFKKAVYQTQNTTDVMNANGFQIDAKNSFWSAMLNMYLNQQQKAGNMVYRLARNISKAKDAGAKKEAMVAAGSFVASMLAATWLSFAIDDSRGKLLGRDIKEKENERLKQRRNQKLLEQGKPIPEESGKARKGLSLLYKYAEANMGNPILKQLTDGLDAVLDNKKSRHNTGGVFGVSDVTGAVTNMEEVIDQEIERYNEDTATPVGRKMMKTVENVLTSKTAGLAMDAIGIQSWIPKWIAEAYKNYKVIPEEIQQKKQKEAIEDAKHQASKQKRADREIRNQSQKWNSYGSNWGNPLWNKKSKKSAR